MFLPNVTDGEQRLAVAMTVYSVCLLNTDHTVSCAGYDPAPVTGILGTESVQPITTVAQKIKLNSGQVPAGLYPTSTSVCVLYVSGSAACWGDGSNGALLSGNTETRGAFAGDMGDNLPLINVGTGRTIKKLFSGGGGFCAILDTDELICWGMNDAGQLGLESSSSPYGASASTIGDSLPRVNLGSHLHVTTLAMGNAHVCAMLNDSSVKCWGANYYGALGYNSSTNFGATNGSMGNNLPKWTSPVLANTTQITCGLDFTCTLNATGRVFCFG
jgi:alpha-tubulin suppressor-like RCC1 family protein